MCSEGNQELTESCTVPVYVPPVDKDTRERKTEREVSKTREESGVRDERETGEETEWEMR